MNGKIEFILLLIYWLLLDFSVEEDRSTAQCQKCLEKGHWTYECTRKRKYVERPSRTQMLEKRVKQIQKERDDEEKNANDAKKKYTQSVLFIRNHEFIF